MKKKKNSLLQKCPQTISTKTTNEMKANKVINFFTNCQSPDFSLLPIKPKSGEALYLGCCFLFVWSVVHHVRARTNTSQTTPISVRYWTLLAP